MKNAQDFASRMHAGQKWSNNKPYSEHLRRVSEMAWIFWDSEEGREDLQTAGWLHDIVEDTDVTLQELGTMFPEEVVRLVGAVTNPPGRTRKERNLLLYPQIRSAGDRAIFLKLCDRMVNIEEGWRTQAPQLFMYHQEYPSFRFQLWDESSSPAVLEMWRRLDRLMCFRW